MLYTVFFHATSSKEFHSLLEVVWKKYSVHENSFYIIACWKGVGEALENLVSIKKTVIDFLTYFVQM